MNELNCFNRQKLYSIINGLKREINCLKTDLLRFKLLSIRYQKYLLFLDEINFTLNDNNIELNNEFRDNISKLYTNCNHNCIVFIENINSNQLKGIKIN